MLSNSLCAAQDCLQGKGEKQSSFLQVCVNDAFKETESTPKNDNSPFERHSEIGNKGDAPSLGQEMITIVFLFISDVFNLGRGLYSSLQSLNG